MSLLQNESSILSNIRVSIDAIDNADQICKLPNDMLLKILSELSTEEAIKTCVLSKRWVDTWKEMSNLCFDMRKTITVNGIVLPQLLDRAAQLMTQVLFISSLKILSYNFQSLIDKKKRFGLKEENHYIFPLKTYKKFYTYKYEIIDFQKNLK